MNKPCLILDLDETVISTLTWNEIRQCQEENSDDCKFLNDNIDKLEKYDWHYDKIPPPRYGKGPTRASYVTFERPGLGFPRLRLQELQGIHMDRRVA